MTLASRSLAPEPRSPVLRFGAREPKTLLLAGGLLAVVVFFLNSLGDHLRDRLDPHRRVR